jgi:single-stranded DNA-binding protein
MINRVTLIGRLGSDAEIKTGKGSPYTLLSLATSSGYYDSEKKWVESTQWHKVLVNWSFEAKKGDTVIVEGELVYYTGSDNVKHAQIRAKLAKQINGKDGDKKIQHTANGEVADDGLPF